MIHGFCLTGAEIAHMDTSLIDIECSMEGVQKQLLKIEPSTHQKLALKWTNEALERLKAIRETYLPK